MSPKSLLSLKFLLIELKLHLPAPCLIAYLNEIFLMESLFLEMGN